ncbi:MAG TPA: hypothetical protein DCE56_05550, partial [Cyanobacteria bacterium UBA8553]|nr:hypothetical protein [Cyanobacteria bacterium UBA8553]
SKPQTRLTNLPARIAKLEEVQLSLRTELKKLYTKRDLLLIPIDRQIAFESECKNKEQRDVKRAELLLANSEYQTTLELIQTKEIELSRTDIKIRQLERQFSIEKLICKWALAFQYSTVSQMFEIDEVTPNYGSDLL